MFFGKRRRKKAEDEPPPPHPEELDDDFGYELDTSGTFEGAPPASRPPADADRRAAPPPPPTHRRPESAAPPPAPSPPESRPAGDRPLVDPAAGSGVGRGLDDATFVTTPPPAAPDLNTTPAAPALGGVPGGDEPADDVTRFVSRPVAPTAEIVSWLVAANGPNRGRDYRLDPGGFRVGSAPDCHLRLPGDTYVSTYHAEITRDGEEHVLRDLASTNGTFRNGERVAEIVLRDDDRVRFGLSDFVFKVARL